MLLDLIPSDDKMGERASQSKKCRAKFSAEEDIRLIHEVEKRPILWDATTDVYKRADLKPQVWAEVALIIGPSFSGEEVMTHFKSMKDTFMRNNRKIQESKRSGVGADDIYKPRWNLYNSLLFLRKVCSSSGSTSNLDSLMWNESPQSATVDIDSQCETLYNYYFDDNLQQLVVIPSDDNALTSSNNSVNDSSSTSLSSLTVASGPISPDLFVPPRPSAAPSTSLSSSGVKRPAENDDSFYSKKGHSKKSGATLMEEAVKVMRDIAKQPPPATEPIPTDREDVFASFIASRLRSMSVETKLQCENAILSVLMQY